MIGDIFQHDFMIKISICDTFELTKRVFSGSGQMPLNTLPVSHCVKIRLQTGAVKSGTRESLDPKI